MNTNAVESIGNGKEISPRRGRPGWWVWLRLFLLGIALAGVTGLVMARPLLPTGQVVLEVGDVAPQDIHAPRPLTYDSDIRRAEEQDLAASRVEPVYTSADPTLAREQLDRTREVLDYLGSVRADTLASTAQKRGWVLVVPELAELTFETLDRFLALSDESWDQVHLETLAVIDQAMRQEIREGHPEEGLEIMPRLVPLDLSNEETTIVIALAQSFLVPNSFPHPEATAKAEARAREEVGPITYSFKEGQIIVREGESVNALDIEAMDQFGLRQPQTSWTDFIGAGLMAVLEVLLLYLYLARFQPDVLRNGQQLFLLVLLVAFFVLGAGLMVPGGEVLRYLSPAPALAMLVTAALGPQAGVAAAIFLSSATGVIADNSFEMTTYAALGGMVAALTLGRVERMSSLFRAGAFAAMAHVGVLAVFYLPQGLAQPSELLIPTLTGIVNGGISASLALGGLFLIGPLFDVITTMRLIELSRPNHPLLQRLLREAPGTYHHSLMVANLAEQAAESIGANALLTRVGAYYHDVGKMVRPYFFAENQVGGMNPHDRLDPHASAEVIIGHVEDGNELVRRHRLPGRVRAFIPEHHGTNRVSFLYEKAVRLAGDDALVDENDFLYSGPKPQSKETALVMLADACEAATRSTRPANDAELMKVVNRIIDQRVDDGQLNECDLTLRDLEIIRRVFISTLKGVFHPRIQYPEPKTAGGRENDAPQHKSTD